jgi:hypothetical protein
MHKIVDTIGWAALFAAGGGVVNYLALSSGLPAFNGVTEIAGLNAASSLALTGIAGAVGVGTLFCSAAMEANKLAGPGAAQETAPAPQAQPIYIVSAADLQHDPALGPIGRYTSMVNLERQAVQMPEHGRS